MVVGRSPANLKVMCGRFTLTEQDPKQLALEVGVDAAVLAGYRLRYNIAPTGPH